MFSGSNSYLGGQAGRSGQQQPQQQYGGFNPQQQPQQQSYGPQPTGYGQAPMQPQFTGYPMQAQPTGFQQQQQQPAPPQMPAYTGFPGQNGPQQSFQQPQQQQQPPALPQKPAPTGFSQMAASFQSSGSTSKPAAAGPKSGTRIPSIRLSFITAKDQAQFETLFKSAIGDSQSMSGDKARDILLRSNLDGNALSQIW